MLREMKSVCHSQSIFIINKSTQSLSEISMIAQTLKEQATSNQQAITSLQSAVSKNANEIKEANVRLLSFRNDLEDIKEKVAEIPELRRIVKVLSNIDLLLIMQPGATWND